MRPAFVLLLGVCLLMLSPLQVAATDGDESTASITNFSETLADDTLFYPDSFKNTTAADTVASAGDNVSCTGGSGSYVDTQTYDGTPWIGSDNSAPYDCQLRLNFTLVDYYDGAWASIIYRFVMIGGTPDTETSGLYGYDFSAEAWTQLHAGWETDVTWQNVSCPFEPGVGTVWLSVRGVASDASFNIRLYYAGVTGGLTHLADADHYAESFADISDWTENGFEALDDTSTDGDVLTFVHHNDGSGNNDYLYANAPSLSLGFYWEICFRYNETNGPTIVLYGRTDVFGSGSAFTITSLTRSTSWATMRGYEADGALECLYFYAGFTTHQSAELCIDYLRCWDAEVEESGWQHDCSTTQGVTGSGGGTVASDADKVTLTADADGSTFDVVFDTTATAAALSCTYYPFLEIRITAGSGTWQLQQYDGSAYATLQTSGTLATGTYRYNTRSQDTSITKLTFTLGNAAVLTYDWAKAYSIANWTLSQGNCEVTDYLYISDSAVYCAGLQSDANEYIRLDHDPAISVASASYPVFNVTTDATDNSAEFYFTMYVAAWGTATDNTRGPTDTGTVTDLRLQFQGDASAAATRYISAVKFIEDSTAPDIVRANVAPTDADDTEAVTLSAVVIDPTEVYEVYFNAITYPSGFSDVNYYAEEQGSNFWNYTFSTLDAGYYCFAVYGYDGANTNSLDYYSYIDFTVREAAIVVNPITLQGAGEDFGGITLSFDCNRAGTYSVWEWTESDASDAAEMWTGSVVNGWNNIYWTKLDTTADTVYFNFTISASGVSDWSYDGEYQVAQTTFYVEYWSPCLDSYDQYAISGHITKLGTYALYEDDSDSASASGTLAALDFEVKWTKQGVPGLHTFDIEFTNGSQTTFINGTYYRYTYDPDREEKGGGLPPSDWRVDEKMWMFIMVGGALVGVVLVIGRVYGIDLDRAMGVKR